MFKKIAALVIIAAGAAQAKQSITVSALTPVAAPVVKPAPVKIEPAAFDYKAVELRIKRALAKPKSQETINAAGYATLTATSAIVALVNIISLIKEGKDGIAGIRSVEAINTAQTQGQTVQPDLVTKAVDLPPLPSVSAKVCALTKNSLGRAITAGVAAYAAYKAYQETKVHVDKI